MKVCQVLGGGREEADVPQVNVLLSLHGIKQLFKMSTALTANFLL